MHNLTGDGVPQICINVYTKSESSSKEVQVYNGVKGHIYSLSAIGKFNYVLLVCEGELYVTEYVKGVFPVTSGRLVLKANGNDYVLDMEKSA